MLPFQDAAPTPAGDWRHIVRFGRNVASYKFALGRALLNLAAQQQTFARLEDLSVPYAAGICEHLLVEDRQSTSARSRFLDACRSRNRGELDAAQLAELTVRFGSRAVISSVPGQSGDEAGQREHDHATPEHVLAPEQAPRSRSVWPSTTYRPGPYTHHKHHSIETQLSFVFAALAVRRWTEKGLCREFCDS